MKNAVIYARYSSDAQKETSIDDQIRDCKKFAAGNGYKIVHIYHDDCVTGKTDDRDQFQKMLSDSTKGFFDTVIVWKLDRFARNRNESAINKVKLKKNGVKVVSAMEHIPDGPEGIILESVLEGIAEYYIYDLMEKTTRGRMGVALQCKHTGGRPLLGYKVNPDRTYAIDEYNAETVRQIFRMYANGASYSEIIDEMNRQGRKTAAGKSFGKNSLHELLRNERFIGIYTYNKIPSENGKRNSHASKPDDKIIRIPGGIPAIVSMDEWNAVQTRMQKNKHTQASHKAKIEYLLSGKIFCGECGGAMVGQSSGNHEKYSYYECSTKKRLRTCHKSNVKKETIENVVIDYTINYILSEKFREKIIDLVLQQDDEKQKNIQLINGLKERIRQNQNEIDNIIRAIKAGIFSQSTKNELEKLESEAELLKDQLLEAETMQSPEYTKEAISAWLSKIAARTKKSENENKYLLYSFVSAVYAYEDGTVKVVYNLGDSEQKIALSDMNGAGDRT
ncbi:recombinase family protein [Caproiciproducens galactitolivorans]|uniref:recombinase family protein n=1 Tax=Caproiciproducens galactitolivorans TaxID=642589 RepID=UPI00240A8E05|nr:recombinase family protein [Caproiciproducens galactitolivorans]